VSQVKQKYIQEGLILDDSGDLGTGGTFESGHLGYLEGIILYDPSNPQSALAARNLVQTGARDAIDRALGLPIAGFGSEANELFGPACSNYHLWLKRIKAALDPQMACDPYFYVEGTQPVGSENNYSQAGKMGTDEVEYNTEG
jgi:glycolate oxidase